MPRIFEVKTDKVPAIERHDGPLIRGGELQRLDVRHGPARMTALLHREHIVTKELQLDDDRRRHVLVGVEPSHSSSRFVRLDQVADFRLV